MARKLAYQALKLVGKNWGKSSLTIEKNRGNIVRLANRLERRFGLEDIHNLKTRHLATLFEEMKAEHLSASTLSGYATAARSIAFAIGKQNIVPRTNKDLGFTRADERYQPIQANADALEEVRRFLYARSEWQGLAHDLRMHFGLRAKESLLSVDALECDGTVYLEVRGAKGGRPRRVPVQNSAQAETLGRIRQFVQEKSQKSLIRMAVAIWLWLVQERASAPPVATTAVTSPTSTAWGQPKPSGQMPTPCDMLMFRN